MRKSVPPSPTLFPQRDEDFFDESLYPWWKLDAIAIESKESVYANLLVVRDDEVDRPDIVALKTAMTSDKMRQFIEEKYKGAVLPAF